MADVQAENYIATYGSVPVGKTASNVNGGRMRVLYDTYEAAGLPDGDTILVGKMDSGFVVYDFALVHDALGATTLQIALRDAEGIITPVSTAIDASSAGWNTPLAADIANLPGFVERLDGPVEVIVINAGDVATGTIKVQLFYSIT